ncbi:MAG: LexA family protein [Christensenellales bacterium]
MFNIALKLLREQQGLSQARLAMMLGVSQSTIGMWESDKNKPEYANLRKLSDIFHVPMDTLSGQSVLPQQFNPERPSGKGVWIPVLGRIQAGIPLDAVEEVLDYEEITKSMASQGEHFALQINGDSMEPRISQGDVVIVRKQNDINSGDVAVVLINNTDATIKRVKKSLEGIMLIPTNPAYEPMFFSNKAIEDLPVRVLGKVVELRAKF